MNGEIRQLSLADWKAALEKDIVTVFEGYRPTWFDSEDLNLVHPSYGEYLLPGVHNEICEAARLYGRSVSVITREPYGFLEGSIHGHDIGKAFPVEQLLAAHTKREDAGKVPTIYLVPHMLLDTGHAHSKNNRVIGLTDFRQGVVIQALGDVGMDLSLSTHSLAHELGHLFGLIRGHHNYRVEERDGQNVEVPYTVVDFPNDMDAVCNMRADVSTATTRVCDRELYAARIAQDVLRQLPRREHGY